MEDSQIASLQNSIADSFAKGVVSSQTVVTMLTSAPEAKVSCRNSWYNDRQAGEAGFLGRYFA